MKKGLFALACICILVALAIDKEVLISSFWSVIKYGCMAYGITLLTYALCSKRITYVNTTLTMMGVILLTCYTIVLVDTFFFHLKRESCSLWHISLSVFFLLSPWFQNRPEPGFHPHRPAVLHNCSP